MTAVAQVEAVGQTLDTVAEVSVSVAAAIEEQTAATHEIARNVAASGEAMLRITGLISEVSLEAVSAGEQAEHVLGNVGAVADDVASLRTALVRTVRTATTEADRRLETRVAVDVKCSVALHAGGPAVAGRLQDLSFKGATIEIASTDGIEVGHLGQVILPHAHNAQARFEVRSMVHPGHLHVRFVEGKTDGAFAAEITRLIQGAGSTSQVA
jgi:hypothetical protein